MSREARSALMAAVKGRANATTDVAVARLFRSLGISGWRRHARIQGCRPDFVFAGQRIAVFVDGCFWHGCPRHATQPATNRSYWTRKLRENRARDLRQSSRLRRSGWSVWRIWECRIKKRRFPAPLLTRLRTQGVGSDAQ